MINFICHMKGSEPRPIIERFKGGQVEASGDVV